MLIHISLIIACMHVDIVIFGNAVIELATAGYAVVSVTLQI